MLWVPLGQSSRAPPRAESSPWRPLGPWKPELVSGQAACAKLPISPFSFSMLCVPWLPTTALFSCEMFF